MSFAARVAAIAASPGTNIRFRRSIVSSTLSSLGNYRVVSCKHSTTHASCRRTRTTTTPIRLCSSSSSSSLHDSSRHERQRHQHNNSTRERRRRREDALDHELNKLGIDATLLREANLQQSMANPTAGYDGRFGKSAIRTYRSFVRPKSSRDQRERDVDNDDDDSIISTLAGRCARQIDFLIKRHKSHEAEWIRHTDDDNVLVSNKNRRQKFPLIIVLDNVRSAFNVGSLFRTADATGCCQVITTGIAAHPDGSGAEKLTKSALGADRMVPSRHFHTTREAIDTLREDFPDYALIGMETTDRSIPYADVDYPKDGVILVLGNEVTGVDTEIMSSLDAVIEIPMFGTKNSLNIAACAPIVLYEILRQWNVLLETSNDESRRK